MVESWGGVSVFAHQRGLGECPSWWGSVMVADWWRRGWWWGCRSAQCPYCCPPPQHRGAQLVILYLSKAEGEGVGQPQKRDGCTRESTEVLLRARCKPAERGSFGNSSKTTSGELDLYLTRAHISHEARKIKRTLSPPCSCCVQVWPDRFCSLTNTCNIHNQCALRNGKSPCLLMDALTEEEEMRRRRRMGGGERGMSRVPDRGICSAAAASAVNSHAWTHIHSGDKRKGTTTHFGSLKARYSSVDPL